MSVCAYNNALQHMQYITSHPTPPPHTHTDIPVNPNPVRLVNGLNDASGRVEIYYNNEWGTICDDFWTLNEAEVVCRSLGFPGAIRATVQGEFGEGSGHIWLDNVQCTTGNEYFIDLCEHPDFGENNCAHYEDAGVVCQRT